MTKNNKNDEKVKRPLFHPTFGSRPSQIVGRDDIIEKFLQGIQSPIGSRDRCTLFIGQRGMGKTALLQELGERAESLGYIVANVTVYRGMNDEIIEIIQRKGENIVAKDKKSVQGVEAGALGFSFGLTFSDKTQEQYGFRTKLTMLIDKLEDYGRGVLILIDEATTSEEMRQLAITYQHLVGENKNISMGLAGLPQSVSTVLNDKVLTFLNRAKKVEIAEIPSEEVYGYYKNSFEQLNIRISPEKLQEITDVTKGFPYMMQLIGYYIVDEVAKAEEKNVTADNVKKAIEKAKKDLIENVYAPILAPLSDMDREFVFAMAQNDGPVKISQIVKTTGKTNSYLQAYRARLIGSGIISAPRQGEVVFNVPYIGEYLRNIRRS